MPELCRLATLAEICEKDYSLAPSNYIEFIDHDLEIDYPAEMTRIQAEMSGLLKLERKAQKMFSEAFRGIGYDID